MNIKAICPFCEQDYIKNIRIMCVKKDFYVCAECESMWSIETKEFTKESCIKRYGLGGYLEAHGISWNDVLWTVDS